VAAATVAAVIIEGYRGCIRGLSAGLRRRSTR